MRELGPPDQVRLALRAVVDVLHAQLLPIGPGPAEAVGHQLAVLGYVQAGQGDRPVGRKGVGVEQRARLGVLARLNVQHRLVLEAGVLGKEVSPRLLGRQPVLGVVPEFGDPLLEPVALWEAVEVGESQLVLALDPLVGLGRVGVLEPSIRVGDFDAMVVVHLLAFRRVGVLHLE